MRRYSATRIAAAVIVVLLAATPPVLAQIRIETPPLSTSQPPPSWDRVDALPPGARVKLTLSSGDRHVYVFRRATADALVVSREAGAVGDETLPKSQVTKVVRLDVRDSVGDGTALGALAGFGVGIGLMAIAYANACDTCDPPAYWTLAGPAGAVGAGGGALIGYLIDRKRAGTEPLFPTGKTTRKDVTVMSR